MVFEFEETLELKTGMPLAELQLRADRLVEQWGLSRYPPDSNEPISQDPVGSLRAVSRKLPELLTQSPGLFRKSTMENSKSCPARSGPRVTVRFVASIEPQRPIRDLFENENQL